MAVSYPFSSKISHFVPPKQWASMRVARELEKKTGQKIIHFEKGDYQGPDFYTPDHVLEATVQALKDGYVRYDPGPGLPELREAIAAETTREGRKTKPEEVIVTAGAKHALTMCLLTFLEEGDEVIFPNPGYPPDEVWAKYVRAKIHHTPLTKPDWQFDLEKLEKMITPKTKLLIINTPQRPNGHLVENPEEIAELCFKYPNLMVISDEIFSHVTYDKPHKTISAVPGMEERTIVIDTFSKTYAMTGAFYAFPDITGTGLTSQEFTDRLVETAGVAVVAGTAFGSQGEGYVRVTYACSDEDIDEGIRRMKSADLKKVA